MVSTTLLSTNEIVGMGTLEIVSIPDISILTGKYPDSQAVAIGYKKDMSNLLAQVYQHCKMLCINDVSLELLWTTHAVSNQPYQANIRLFVLARAIGNDKNSVEKNINAVLQIVKTTLDIQKYKYETVEYESIETVIKSIDNQSICAVVKEERLENLQNQIMPFCYAFDRIPESETDLSKIAYTLINYPNCAVSFQLIPAAYTLAEMQDIDQNTHILDNLNKGLQEQGVGNISFSLAEKQTETYKYYAN